MPATSAKLLARPRKATYDDVLDAPPHNVAEIIDGILYMHARPAFRHASAITNLGSIIVRPFHKGIGGPGGWIILGEPELHLGEGGKDVLVPDFAGWRREGYSEGAEIAYFSTAPDWVCELLSPSTRNLDQGRKNDIYSNAGISYLWFIDPVERTLTADAQRNGIWKRIVNLRGDASASVPPFDAIPFQLSELWEDDDWATAKAKE